jgi:hypothetical protein
MRVASPIRNIPPYIDPKYSLPCSQEIAIHFTHLHSVFVGSNFILAPFPRLDLSSFLPPSGYWTKIVYVFLICLIRATLHAHLILLTLLNITAFCEVRKLWGFSFCIFIQPPVTFSFIRPNILFSTLFSGNHSLCSFVRLRDKISLPFKTQKKKLILSRYLVLCTGCNYMLLHIRNSKWKHINNFFSKFIRQRIQKFPDRVDNEIYAYLWYYSLRSNTKDHGDKTHYTDSQNSNTTAPGSTEL